LPKVPQIAALLRAKIVPEADLARQEIELNSNASQRLLLDKEIFLVSLQALEQICLSLASYLEQNELANVEDLALVQNTLNEVFPQSLYRPQPVPLDDTPMEPAKQQNGHIDNGGQ
jgi:hypothetical protein